MKARSSSFWDTILRDPCWHKQDFCWHKLTVWKTTCWQFQILGRTGYPERAGSLLKHSRRMTEQ